MDIVQYLLNLLLARAYQLTDHAIEGMDEDDFTFNDLLSCLASGRLRRSWPRQRKYEVEGRSTDGRVMRVVARLLNRKLVRIITVYEAK
jgi:hypothetical protein